MQIGAFTCWFGTEPLEQVLEFLDTQDIHSVEIGTGGYPGDVHCRPADLLADPAKLDRFRQTVAAHETSICALSCMGNPLHPDPATASLHHAQFRQSVLLAERLGVGTVSTFAGCPGTPDVGKYPNWVTTRFPGEFAELLDWQWTEKVLPYWHEQAGFCRDHGVRVAIELHPGFVVHNPATLAHLRAEIGPVIGAAYDPSHMVWQQMDPLAVIPALGPAIYHVHAKDTVVDRRNTARNGILDIGPSSITDRSWAFRTVGVGHGIQWWSEIITALAASGYEGTLSIEAEDAALSCRAGIVQAVTNLRSAFSLVAFDRRASSE